MQTDIPNPQISIDGTTASSQQVRLTKEGFYEIDLKAGQTATLSVKPLAEADLTIQPIPVKAQDRNLFGLNQKTERLPGHRYYYKK